MEGSGARLVKASIESTNSVIMIESPNSMITRLWMLSNHMHTKITTSSL